MPELEIAERKLYETNVEYNNQEFNIKLWMSTGTIEDDPEWRFRQDVKVTQVRSAHPDDETIGYDQPFLDDAVHEDYSVVLSQVMVERDRIAHRLRPFVREALKIALNNSWSIWVRAPKHEELEETKRSVLNSARLVFLGRGNASDFADLMNDWLIANVNDFFGDWECPNGYDDCPFFHLDDWEHVQLWSGHWTPNRYSLSYWVQEEQIITSSGLNPPGASWNDFCDHAGIRWCGNCDEPSYSDEMQEVALGEYWCDGCSYYLAYCERCDQPMNGDNSYEIEEVGDEGDYDAYTYEVVCLSCYEAHRRGTHSLSLNNYTFKPAPSFHKGVEENTEMFFGMELEVARDRRGDCEPINRWIKKAEGSGLLYCKADSSVNYGFEIVSHPFSYEWAKRKFPYWLFEELLVLPGILPQHPSAGTHVHMSKDGFTSPGLWKFIKFHLDLPDFAGIIGERGATADYGSLKREADVMQRQLKDVAIKKGKGGNLLGMSRSVGINLQPADTVELRYLAGNVEPAGIRKNIEWVEAVLRFTSVVSVANARKGALKDPGYFLGWLEDQDDFDALKTFVQKAFPTPKKLEV